MNKGTRLFSSLLFSLFFVTNLQPSWNALGGGVYSAYYGAGNGVDENGYYNPVSPGAIGNYDGRSAAPISAGVSASSTGEYDDQGLFAFNTGDIPVAAFATEPLSYDFENQYGKAPVWMYIELNKEASGDSVYQYVPTTNPASWHSEDAAAGDWQEWTNLDNGVATGTPLSLASIASANPSATVDRVYLTEGIGDSYHATDHGTLAWVDTVTIGDTVYNFATTTATTTDSDASTSTPTTATTTATSTDSSTNTTSTDSTGSGQATTTPTATSTPVVNFGGSGGFVIAGSSIKNLLAGVNIPTGGRSSQYASPTPATSTTNSIVATSSINSLQASTFGISHHPKTKNKTLAVVTPPKKSKTTIPQTASVYDASQQSGSNNLGSRVSTILSAFWSALKKFF